LIPVPTRADAIPAGNDRLLVLNC